MVLVVSDDEIRDLLDLAGLVDVVSEALVAQAKGETVRPERPHFPVGEGLDGEEPLGTGLTMPAYVHGEPLYATKLVGVHEGNVDRGLPTIHAQLALTDARTGEPAALMSGTTITNARTGSIGAVAVRALAPETFTLGVLGAGVQARWQTRAIDTVASPSDVRVYSPSDSRAACAADLRETGVPATAVDSPAAAVEGADVVVTATTASEPVFPSESLSAGALVVAIGAYTAETQELAPAVVEEAAVFADVPEEVIRTGDFLGTDLGVEDLVALGRLLGDEHEQQSPEGVTVVASVGSAVLDAATGIHLYERAREADAGIEVSL